MSQENQGIQLNLDIADLKGQGFSISTIRLSLEGIEQGKFLTKDILSNKDNSFWHKVFSPIVTNACKADIQLFHFKLLQEVFKYWSSHEYAPVLDEFIDQNLTGEYLKQVMQAQFLNMHVLN